MTPDDPLEITESERPVRSDQPTSPRSEVWRALRAGALARDADRDEARRRVAQDSSRFAMLATALAHTLHQVREFRLANADALGGGGADDAGGVLDAIVGDQHGTLWHLGVRVLDPAGAPFDDDVAAWADVAHSERVAGLSAPTVIRTLRPGVLLLATGELVCRASVQVGVPAKREEGTA